MPIIFGDSIDTSDNKTNDLLTTTYSASKKSEKNPLKFFDKNLTGNGKGIHSRSGIINADVNPFHPGDEIITAERAFRYTQTKKKFSGNNNTKFTIIPLSAASAFSTKNLLENAQMENVTIFHPTTHGDNAIDVTDTIKDVYTDLPTNTHCWVSLTPATFGWAENKVTDDTEHTTTHKYKALSWVVGVTLYNDKALSSLPHVAPTVDGDYSRTTDMLFDKHGCVQFFFHSKDWLDGSSNNFHNFIDSAVKKTRLSNISLNDTEAVELHEDVSKLLHQSNYSTYDQMVRLAEEFSSHDHLLDAVTDFARWTHEIYSVNELPRVLNPLAYMLKNLENFEVDLTTYQDIFRMLVDIFDTEIAGALSRQNMQITLSNHMNTIDTLKNNGDLAYFNPSQPEDTSTIDPKYSLQQVAAIRTRHPVSIVQAGAGTGKSTVILQRINHLIANGVDPEKITVASFTNAAANNIKSKNSDIVSTTIASRIHDIYKHNFPDHELSSMNTMANAMMIHYGDQVLTNEFLYTFYKMCTEIAKDQSNGAMSALANFTERYTDSVIEVLNTIRQTSLEMESILAYILIDKLDEPFVAPEFFIVDEVQDNSIFEFIYCLRYTIKHRCSLFIVGDSSQTLYEFRSSNPKALNALEASGVFTPYRLTTNYRSHQEILDFANLQLQSIEANNFANIQLNSNIITDTTLDSFTSKVNIQYEHLNSSDKFHESIPRYLSNQQVTDYINRAMEKGEQVCVLGLSHTDIRAAESYLNDKFGTNDKPVVGNLTSKRMYPDTMFSTYVSHFFDEVETVDVDRAAFIFTQQIVQRAPEIAKLSGSRWNNIAENVLGDNLRTWWSQNQHNIVALVNAHKHGSIDRKDFFHNLKKSILDFEIAFNAAKSQRVRINNEKRKKAIMDNHTPLVVSTVHGAKGLEFDHVILLYKPRREENQETRRILYVAMTRAKKSEYIITASNHAMPSLVTNYQTLCHQLEEKAATGQ